MKIYLASSNEHKRKEMQNIFCNYEVLLPKDNNIQFSPIENGKTFFENSLIKAETLWNIVKTPVLADDSGICLDALNGLPGIYSARYAGKDGYKNENSKLSSQERNILLMDELNTSSNPDNRKCHFVCSLIYYFGKDQFYGVQETLEGEIITSFDKVSGTNGFGYDPIFYLPNYKKTVAELTDEEKNAISHRGKACAKMLLFLKNNNPII